MPAGDQQAQRGEAQRVLQPCGQQVRMQVVDPQETGPAAQGQRLGRLPSSPGPRETATTSRSTGRRSRRRMSWSNSVPR